MAIDPEFKKWVEETLGRVTPVRVRAMFGGLGIYSGDLFFAIADDKRIYLKVDDTNRGDFVERGIGPFVPFENEPNKTMSYHELPGDVMKNEQELVIWVEKALAVAERAKRPRKTSRSQRSGA